MCSGLYLCIGIFKYLPHEILSHFGWYRNRRAGHKNVNDTHGHLAGDEVLREASRRIGAAVRSYDAVGRYGG
ncbi:MAG: diguanylate cyclase [Acidobacteria bacterium]|nr:diguanylate cyclase [Acidobacteriota bacterium]